MDSTPFTILIWFISLPSDTQLEALLFWVRLTIRKHISLFHPYFRTPVLTPEAMPEGVTMRSSMEGTFVLDNSHAQEIPCLVLLLLVSLMLASRKIQ